MDDPGMCEICLRPFEPEDLEDGVTLSADCCERVGLCRYCRLEGEHDCDEHEYSTADHVAIDDTE